MAKVNRFFVDFKDGRKEVGIGDKCYSVCQNNHGTNHVITAFGNKYLTVDDRDQYEINTGVYKNRNHFRVLWSSEEAYRADKLLNKTRGYFNNIVTNHKYSLEQIYEAAKILGISEELEARVQKGR